MSQQRMGSLLSGEILKRMQSPQTTINLDHTANIANIANSPAQNLSFNNKILKLLGISKRNKHNRALLGI